MWMKKIGGSWECPASVLVDIAKLAVTVGVGCRLRWHDRIKNEEANVRVPPIF